MIYHNFLSKTFRLTVPKNFVREPFCVSKIFWNRRIFMDRRREENHVSPSKLFCLTVPKIFAGGTLVFQKCSGVEFFSG